ncbi:hypothetical protein Salat_1358400 [Sesamum alatum]|uniref:C2 domain-containing protein n=1 Tax=Sesamum alatum TaxID=300844 RepID=A0AAE2CQB7_9LAMI|nr:hypothetical protein Salat_1358400 [Sesamum alatum]
MDPQHHSCSLSLELRITSGRNINLKSSGDLFVRCYLPAGGNKRVRLDSQQASSTSSNCITWDQTLSLDCSGTQDSIKYIKQSTILFELRLRRSSPFIGWINGSKLVARAEVPWNDIINVEIDKWIVMIPEKGCVYDDVKPPAVQIGVRVQEFEEVVERKKSSVRRWDECGCMDGVGGCNSCVDYEFFAIGAALEAF